MMIFADISCEILCAAILPVGQWAQITHIIFRGNVNYESEKCDIYAVIIWSYTELSNENKITNKYE